MVVIVRYNYLCNQYLSPLMLWVRIPLRRGVLDTTLCDNVCKWLATGLWFSLDIRVSFNNKTDRHNITEILLKVALNAINQTKPSQRTVSLWYYTFTLFWNIYIIMGLFRFLISNLSILKYQLTSNYASWNLKL